MQNMLGSLLLLVLLFIHPAIQQQTVGQQLQDLNDLQGRILDYIGSIVDDQVELSAGLGKIEAEAVSVGAQLETLLAVVGATQNATSQLLTELDTLRGRQAASAAVQASQALILVLYLLTTISIYVVKRCRKVREKSQLKEFELLEKKLLSNKAKRRAAAAREKSAPAPSQK